MDIKEFFKSLNFGYIEENYNNYLTPFSIRFDKYLIVANVYNNHTRIEIDSFYLPYDCIHRSFFNDDKRIYKYIKFCIYKLRKITSAKNNA